MTNQFNSVDANVQSMLLHWLQDHQRHVTGSLHRLVLHPISSMLTLLVIGLALALPALLMILQLNSQSLLSLAKEQSVLTLYLPGSTNLDDARTRIKSLPGIRHVQIQDANASLLEFEALTHTSGTADLLGHNPMPAVITIEPSQHDLESMSQIAQSIHALFPTADIELDAAWMQRLFDSLEILHRLFISLLAGMSLAVLLAITNTIRLAVESRRDEVVLLKLLGATHRMVRRPFLYMGFWYGLLGGLIGAALVLATVFWLNIPIEHLARLYHTDFHLDTHLEALCLGIPALAALLGISGAFFALYQHLKALEPH